MRPEDKINVVVTLAELDGEERMIGDSDGNFLAAFEGSPSLPRRL